MPHDLPPTLDDIARLAAAAVAAFPDRVRALASEVALLVDDFASDTVLDDLGIEDGYDLTGLYDGIPLTEKALSDPAPHPYTVWLYRRPILDEWVARGDIGLGELVAHVVIHEFAHHFGWTDAEIARIAPWQD